MRQHNESVRQRLQDFEHRVPPQAIAAMFDENGNAIDYSTWTDEQKRALRSVETDPVKLAAIEQRIRRSRSARVAALESALPRHQRAEFRRRVRRDDLAHQHRIPLAPVQRSSGHANAHARCWNRRTPRRKPGRSRRRRGRSSDDDGSSSASGGGS